MRNLLAILLLTAAAISSPALAQWTEPVRISEPGACLYPQILAQGDSLHVVFMHWVAGRGVGYLRSTDTGLTWSEEVELTDTQNTEAPQFPKIMALGDILLAVWEANFTHGASRYNIAYSLSQDDGISWTPPDYVLTENWQWPFYLTASGADSTINVMASWGYAYTMYFYNVRSTDFGQSWSEPIELFMAEMSSWVDQVSYNNMVYFAWGGYFESEEAGDLYYIKSTNGGVNWSANAMLSDNDEHPSQLPSLCADETGRIAVSWWDFKYSPYWTTGDILMRKSSDNGVTWDDEERITQDSRADWSDNSWSGNTIHVVWQDWRFGAITVFYASSPDSIHDWSNRIRLEDDPSESEDPVVASTGDRVYVIWADDRCDPDTDICGGIYFTRLDTQVGIEENGDLVVPDNYSLEVYPNPFNSTITISVKMQKGGEARLGLYDVGGRLVKTIFKEGNLERGTHKFTWDATDAKGKAVSSGLYFAVAGTPQGEISRRLTLIR